MDHFDGSETTRSHLSFMSVLLRFSEAARFTSPEPRKIKNSSLNLSMSRVTFLLVLGTHLVGVAQGSTMLRRTVAKGQALGAVCNDNSTYVYYYSASKNASKRWIIYMEGGGGCSTPAACRTRYQTERSLMTASVLPASVTSTDVLSTERTLNSPFFDHNRVMLPYCSSDLWLAGLTSNLTDWSYEDAASTGSRFTFNGARIFRLVVEELIADLNLSQASQVLLSGTSAGGIGAMNHAGWLKTRLISAGAMSSLNLVSVLVDSAWFVDFRSSISSRFGGSLLTTASSLSPCQQQYGKTPCCTSLECMLERQFFTKDVPVFVLQSSFDVYVLGEALKRQANQPDLTLKKARRVVVLYRAHSNSSMTAVKQQFDRLSKLELGCSQHGYFAASSLWTGVFAWRRKFLLTSANGQLRFEQERLAGTWRAVNSSFVGVSSSITSKIERWWRRNELITLPERCRGLLCHKSCPETVDAQPDITGTALEGWHWVAIVIGLFVPVVSSIIETILCYYGHLLKAIDEEEQLDGENQGMPYNEDGDFDIRCIKASYVVQYSRAEARSSRTSRPLDTSGRNSENYEERLRQSINKRTAGIKCIVNNISVSFQSGNLIAVMGPSGCGKSTLLNLITGRYPVSDVSTKHCKCLQQM